MRFSQSYHVVTKIPASLCFVPPYNLGIKYLFRLLSPEREHIPDMESSLSNRNLGKYLDSPWVIFVTAFLLRALYLFIRGPENFQASDSSTYEGLSLSLLAGEGYGLGRPSALRPPGYPLFLAATYWIFGLKNHLAVQFLHILMGAGTPLLIREIGREIKDGPTGTIAAWIGVFQINLIFWTGYLLTEALFIPFLVLTFYLVVRLSKRDTTRNLIFAGLAMGALLLIRPSAVPFVALVYPWYAWVRRRRKQKIFSPLCILIFSTALVVLPWVARNYSVFDRFIPLTTGGPGVLHWGTQWNSVDRDMKAVGLTDKKQRDEFEKRDEYMRIFVAYVKENPGRYSKLMVQKAAVFWSLYFPQWSARHKAFKGIFFGLLFGLSLLGLVSSRVDREYAAVFWIFCLSTTLLVMVTVVDYDNRFRVPVEAILSVTAALGFFRAKEIWTGRRQQNPARKDT